VTEEIPTSATKIRALKPSDGRRFLLLLSIVFLRDL
jgi:hypothetical protein